MSMLLQQGVTEQAQARPEATALVFKNTRLTYAALEEASNRLAHLLKEGITRYGISHIAYIQYWAACLLSAILDNNIVADFASKALHGLSLGTIKLFSMAQIAGYAIGGCWTHIGCAQSVVAYAFIQRDVDKHYTPVQWIRAMTPAMLEMLVVITVIIYLEHAVLSLWR